MTFKKVLSFFLIICFLFSITHILPSDVSADSLTPEQYVELLTQGSSGISDFSDINLVGINGVQIGSFDQTNFGVIGGSPLIMPQSSMMLSTGTLEGSGTDLSSNEYYSAGDIDVFNELNAHPDFSSNATLDAASISFSFSAEPGIQSVFFSVIYLTCENPGDEEYLDAAVVMVDGVNYAKFSDGRLLSYYNDDFLYENTSGSFQSADETKGFENISKTLRITAPLDTSLSTHTIKIAIADNNDPFVDSAILISRITGSTSTSGGISEESLTYSVNYNGNGSSSGAVPVDNNDYEAGDLVTVLGNTGSLQRTGYAFTGWNTSADGTGNTYYPASTFSIGSSDITLFAQWQPIPNTAYTVRHYRQDVAGSGYTLFETENLSGTTDTTATAVAKIYTGFAENTDHASRVPSGNIAGDGSLELALYYDRILYDVSFVGFNAADLGTQSIRYDGSATAPTAPVVPGYTFNNWDNPFDNISSDLTVNAVYTANADTAYTVRHYRQDVAGSGYTLFETENLSGTTDTTATALAKSYTGFAENTDHASRVPSGNIAGDGSLELALYYDRILYDVSFVGFNAADLGTQSIRYGGSATAPTAPVVPGYTFNNWDNPFDNISSDLTVNAVYTANADTAYTVRHYRQDVAGSGYTLFETENLSGTTDTTATALAKSYTGFAENTDHASRVPSGNIAGDGSLVLNLYYDRILYDVSFVGFNAADLGTQSIRYGGSATAPTAPVVPGYTFDNWDNPFDNISSDLTVNAVYTANANTAYTVRHYRQDVTGSGYTLFETENLSGTTNTIATALAKTYTGFTENTDHASRVPSGNIAGDGSLELALYYDRILYDVSFVGFNAADLGTQSIRYGGSATAPTAPVVPGYTFDSWDKTFANISSNLTVNAVYTINSYQASFNSNGGSAVQPLNVEFDSFITRPIDPIRAAFKFIDWYKNASFTERWSFVNDKMPASDIVLFARWLPTPAAPSMTSRTSTSITLSSTAGGILEYRINGGTWQRSAEFKNLLPDTEYTFEVRVAAEGSLPASYISDAVKYRTNKIIMQTPSPAPGEEPGGGSGNEDSGSTEDPETAKPVEGPVTGAIVEAVGQTSFDPNTVLSVQRLVNIIVKAESAPAKVNLVIKTEGKEIAELFDIKLLIEDQPIQPNGIIRIRIPLSESLLAIADQLEIHYIDNEGNYEVMPSFVEDGFIVFETDHLSYYAIIAPLSAAEPDDTEQTIVTTPGQTEPVENDPTEQESVAESAEETAGEKPEIVSEAIGKTGETADKMLQGMALLLLSATAFAALSFFKRKKSEI